jgi:hypothetical protein
MNNSWGGESDGQYTSDSRQYDQFVWDHKDYTICFGAGNGNQKLDLPTESTLDEEASAKNVITVGAAESIRWLDNDDSRRGMANFSSRGPCRDGRIKPDVVAPGTGIYSTLASQENTSERDDYYCYKGGTSMASPMVAGSAAIIREYLIKNRQKTSPSAALVKAILCTGAYSLYPSKNNIPFSRPNPVEGHGHINVKESLEPTDGKIDFAEMSFSQSGESITKVFNKAANCNLNVGLVWTDYPGTIGAAKALVNDLDLYVVAPDGKTYTLDDHLNNVEVIRLYNAPAGEYKVIVKANTIMEADQPCAIVFHYKENDSSNPLDIDIKNFSLNTKEVQWTLKSVATLQTIHYTAKIIDGSDKFTVEPASGSFTSQTSITIKSINNSSKRGYDWGVIEIDCGDFGKITKRFGRPNGNKDDGYVLFESNFKGVPADDLSNYDIAWSQTEHTKIKIKKENNKEFLRLIKTKSQNNDQGVLIFIGVPEGHSTNLDLHVSANLRLPKGLESFFITQDENHRQFQMQLLYYEAFDWCYLYWHEKEDYFDRTCPTEKWVPFDLLLNLLPSNKILKAITFYDTTQKIESKFSGSEVKPSDKIDFWQFYLYLSNYSDKDTDYVDISDFTVTLDPPTPEPGFLALIAGLMLLLKKRI